MAKRRYGELPEFDSTNPSRFAINFAPDRRAFLASLAASNGSSESSVVNFALDLLADLSRLGVEKSFTIEPVKEGELPVYIVMSLNLSDAVYTAEDYERLRTEAAEPK